MDLARLKGELTMDEGRRLKPYVDTKNKVTIGIGRNLTDCGISADELELMFDNDVRRTISALDGVTPWWRSLTDTRQYVLANMCFNMGIVKLMEFHNMLNALEAGDWNRAADEMQASVWFTEVKGRGIRLVALMRAGV